MKSDHFYRVMKKNVTNFILTEKEKAIAKDIAKKQFPDDKENQEIAVKQ